MLAQGVLNAETYIASHNYTTLMVRKIFRRAWFCNFEVWLLFVRVPMVRERKCTYKCYDVKCTYFVGIFAEAGFPFGAHLCLAQNLKSFCLTQVLILRAWHEGLTVGLQIVRSLSEFILLGGKCAH